MDEKPGGGGGKHLREALRKSESPRERDPRKEKTKWGTTHDKRVVRNKSKRTERKKERK